MLRNNPWLYQLVKSDELQLTRRLGFATYNYGLCERNRKSNALANELILKEELYVKDDQLTFPLYHLTQILTFKNETFSKRKPESGTQHAIALCKAPNLAYESIRRNFTHPLQNETFFRDHIYHSDYESALIWCNNQIQSSLKNLTHFTKSQMISERTSFHTGSKYHSENYLIDENGKYTDYNDTLYIFQICKNDVFWTTNFHGTKYRYLCCVNYAQRLGWFLTLLCK